MKLHEVMEVTQQTAIAAGSGRVAGYLELAKPRVTAMVVLTTVAGFALALAGWFDPLKCLNLALGTTIASGGALALNQYLERDCDAIMLRTRHRPLPQGRLSPSEALWFGSLAALLGVAYLLVTVGWLCAALTALTAVTYLLAYTPLKRRSWLCNLVGAVPGALPPVTGWAAARGSLGAEPLVLFAIMVLWQMPHALSIAELYRDDFVRARIWRLPLDRNDGYPQNPVIVGSSIALIVVATLPTLMGFAGIAYLVTAAALGCAMLGCTLAFVRGTETVSAARRLMFASLVYVPVVFVVMVLDKL